MAEIHELSAVLADQIAAGEVVERPASVVKELVENALDAKAAQITIETKEAGLEMIRVTDDGEGIEADDVETAFKRHATSKITSREDLFRVATLGFRGEALPSIASVSDIVLMTAHAGDETGTTIHIKGGKIVSNDASQLRNGTQITVSDLFFNTPARLKYLSSLATELSHVSDIVNRLALSHSDVAFVLKNNGKTLLKTAGNGNQKQTFSAIYGVKAAAKMISFNAKDLDFEVDGMVSYPELTRSNRNGISLLINGRYIRNFKLTKAVLNGYGSKLMVGRFPYAVINIRLDPLLCDVNVHPTKQEVRISKEPQLEKLISEGIFARLSQENLIPNAVKNLNHSKRTGFSGEQTDLLEKSPKYKGPVSAEVTAALVGESLDDKLDGKQNVLAKDVRPIVISKRTDLEKAELKIWDQKYVQKKTSVKDQEISAESSQKRFPELRYIGQMHGTYLFAESADGLYIIDQHAAQERCKYEYYRTEIGNVSSNQQRLLVPIVLTYPTTDSLKIEENLDKLANLGIELEDFGKNTYILRQHPTWFKQGEEEEIVREMIDMFLNDDKLTVAKFREKTAIMMSCKRSIKANHHLEEEQAKVLLKKLSACENPFNCPHGRPVLVHFTSKDMEHMFKRIQDPHQTGFDDEL
ncbi:DNA mismatch repair endonuclease MutL [Ligilactobacillus ruminis]|uniref:DNA mismatch repair protein MutL n=1 Tax=Ligilactobacillus ruminis TaxID=1623 RepID=A0A8B2Z0B5_9LACO|nr:DNA mismatch repair endonuclease MutL [Ligilactobacillus ruminis]RGK47556.1 DNA mismatch repair endonuclease MutL [Ligilactobacillus ruminis]